MTIRTKIGYLKRAAMDGLLRPFLLAGNPISRVLLAAYRATLPAKVYGPRLMIVLKWLVTSKEVTNFTYDLTKRNLTYLAEAISVVTSAPVAQVEAFLSEPGNDTDLIQHIKSRSGETRRRSISDETPRFGRRLGWYAIVRLMKPRIVIETGVDKGLGSVLLCHGLLKNRSEGFEGLYFGTDINPEAGFLLSGKWAEVGKILYGDSIESLRTLVDPVDLFINDSEHSAEYELAEYREIEAKLSPVGIVLGDNSCSTDSLAVFARETGRRFLYFAEQPLDHWYPGSGIGLCFPNERQDRRYLDSTHSAATLAAGRANETLVRGT